MPWLRKQNLAGKEAGPLFINLNDAEYFTKDRSDHYWWWEPGYSQLYEMWRKLGVLEGMPPLESIKRVSLHPSAQFVVSRRAIRLRPALFWESALSAALVGYGANKEVTERPYRQDSQGVNWFGAAFEHIWHVVFGQLPVYLSFAQVLG